MKKIKLLLFSFILVVVTIFASSCTNKIYKKGYTVFHYVEPIEGDDQYILKEQETFTGVLNEKTEIKYKEYDGYTPNPSGKEVSIAKKANEKSYVNLYYTRNRSVYKYVTTYNDEVIDTIRGVIKYGATQYLYSAKSNLPEDAVFEGWYVDNELFTTNMEYYFKAPNKDVTYYARFVKKQ